MSTAEYIRILKRMDRMIRSRSTGTPEDFARRLAISERTLYNYLSLMKELGAPIRYSRYSESYIYNEDGGLKPLSEMPDDVKACFEGIETMTIGEMTEVNKLKTTSKRGAIQDLAKMLGWNEADKIEHSGDITIEI
jgi:predicted DNA-binding transcriptional regulator YafY